MIKGFLTTIIILLYSQFAFAQSSRSELAHSKIYFRATYIENKNDIIGLQTRTDLADTTINHVIYHKFQTADFTDYDGNKTLNTYYESFADSIYTLLDYRKNTIHKINYLINNEQTGIIFDKQSTILLEFIDTRNSYPRDSLKPTIKTPRKYYQKDSADIYLIIIPDLQSLVVASNGRFYTKQLMGDNYNAITNGFKNSYTATSKFDIQKGDEVQLFYRRKWYDDQTDVAKYEDKQFKNFRYIGDTILKNTQAMIMETEGYNYLSGSYDRHENVYIYLTDSGYYSGYQFVHFQTYKTELKLVETERGKDLFLQGVTFDTINGNAYPKIVQAQSGPYRYYILPFFPMPFIEFGNVQGIITYTKIKGIEKGQKRARTYITDRNNIRDIFCLNKKEIGIKLYFTEKAKVEIQIQDNDIDKTIATIKAKTKKGLNLFRVKSDNFIENKQYNIQINYQGKESSGSFSQGLKFK
jgi:nitrogen regulatory protein PII